MAQPPSSTARGTALGVLAIVLWSTVFAFSRSLAERLGTLTAPTLVLVVGGGLGCAWTLARGGLRGLGGMPARQVLASGGLFVLYQTALYLAVGLAADRRQLIEVGIINYLWPGLTLLLAVPLLHCRARAWLAAGMALATAGVVLAMARGGEVAWDSFRAHLLEHPWPYGLALVGAVAWAVYSNLARRWVQGTAPGLVPFFLLASGLVLGLARLVRPEQSEWTWPAAAELLYMAAFPALVAYVSWNAAMRTGRMTLVVALSYATPLLSTLASSLYLGVRVGSGLWAACGLVVGGAIVCHASIREPESRPAVGGGRPPT